MVGHRALAPRGLPAFTPTSFGLLSVAQDITTELEISVGPHWQAGVLWQPLCPDADSTFDACLAVTGTGASPAVAAKAPTFTNQRRGANAFTIYVRKDCSTPTWWQNAPGDVVDALTYAEAFDVELAFWTGKAGGVSVVYPHLAANSALVQDNDTLQIAATDVTGGATAVSALEGLSRLETAIAACYRGQGVIHMTYGTSVALRAWGLLERIGNRYYTVPNGNLAAIGAGYPGSAPDGTAATTAATWMYATGAVFYARSPLREFSPVSMLDRSTNTIQAMAERSYVLGWDCCLQTVKLDLTKTITG